MKFLAILEKSLKYICGILLCAMTIVMFMQVIARYVFNSAFVWTDELAIYSMVWMIMLGSGINAYRGSHIRVDFFISWLPVKVRNIIEVIDQLVCAGVISYIVYYGWRLVPKNIGNISAGLRVPTAVLYASISVGGVLMAILFLGKAIQYAINIKKGGQVE